jgi:hypothetical protein
MTTHRKYEPATRCTGGPSPGAKALMAWFTGAFGHLGGKNLGIYNCRPVRGSTMTTSLHGEGRACDLGINPHGAEWGTSLAEMLRTRSGELGIQCLIWDRRIWSAAYPDAGWRLYSGTNPHRDHIHLELSKASASGLTPQTIQRVLAPRTQNRPAVVVPAKTPPLPVPREGSSMTALIKSQPDKTKPEYVSAILSGFNFVGLGRTETPTDEQARQMGVPVFWVEYGTYQEFDRRSHVMLGSRPAGSLAQNGPSAPNLSSPSP